MSRPAANEAAASARPVAIIVHFPELVNTQCASRAPPSWTTLGREPRQAGRRRRRRHCVGGGPKSAGHSGERICPLLCRRARVVKTTRLVNEILMTPACCNIIVSGLDQHTRGRSRGSGPGLDFARPARDMQLEQRRRQRHDHQHHRLIQLHTTNTFGAPSLRLSAETLLLRSRRRR
jgi:hypothetical protein